MTIFYPYELRPTRIDNFLSNSFSVDISRSISGLETRVLLADTKTDGILNLIYDPIDNIDILWNFFELTNGVHLPFQIPQDHYIWDILPCNAYNRYNILWRFYSEQLSFSRIDQGCLYTTDVQLINVLA